MDMSERSVDRIQRTIARVKRENDIVVASIHWGPNWGYDIPRSQLEFAHELIDCAGVDVIHGHSSHHVKAVEVYRGRLILYGCGDFLRSGDGFFEKAFCGDAQLTNPNERHGWCHPPRGPQNAIS
jgi:poly-gamma-glutamate synthesis protein (capsule biosynthesis protein)